MLEPSNSYGLFVQIWRLVSAVHGEKRRANNIHNENSYRLKLFLVSEILWKEFTEDVCQTIF